MIKQEFPLEPGISNSSILFWEVLFVLGHAFNSHPGTLRLCPGFHILLLQKLKVNQGESLGFSLVSYKHAHSSVHAFGPKDIRGLLDSQEYVSAFRSSLWTSYDPAFLVNHFVQDFVSLNYYLLLQAAVMFTCFWLFSTNVHGGIGSCTGWALSQVK